MSLCRLKKIADNLGLDDRAWFINAICLWESGEQLDVALGLCGSTAIANRNQALRLVANILNEDDLYSIHHISGLIELAISRFETRVLKRYRKNPHIVLTEIDKLLLVMFQPGCRPVRKQRQIFDYIK